MVTGMGQRVGDDGGGQLVRPQRFSADGKKAFSPKSLPGLRLWLDASQITGIADGNPIGQWNDASGLGHHATSTGANRPKYRAAGSKDPPAVIFDGSSSWMIVPALLATATPITLYCVILPGDTGARRLLDVQTGPTYFYWRNSAGQTGVFNDGAERNCAAALDDAVQILTFVCSTAGGITFRRDGANIANAHAFVNTALSGTIRIGSDYDGGSAQFLGELSELIVCAAAHSAGHVASAEGYLQSKYGGG